MKRKILKIGTRGSPLAIVQAEMVASKLKEKFDFIEPDLVPIKTTGDKILDKTLSKIGGKGLFTKEIEGALLENKVQIAVHSMKDMPTLYPEGLTIPCMLEREDPRDVLISKGNTSLEALPSGSIIGTSSLRRQAQVLESRPDIRVIPFRGNIQTRLRKIAEGEADATLLAYAGLKRMGLTEHIAQIFEPFEMTPAVGQGAIGVQCREDDSETLSLLAEINHPETEICVEAERAFLQELGGSCQTPIGGYATLHGEDLHLQGFVAKPSGQVVHRLAVTGVKDDSVTLGVGLATKFFEVADPSLFEELG